MRVRKLEDVLKVLEIVVVNEVEATTKLRVNGL